MPEDQDQQSNDGRPGRIGFIPNEAPRGDAIAGYVGGVPYTFGNMFSGPVQAAHAAIEAERIMREFPIRPMPQAPTDRIQWLCCVLRVTPEVSKAVFFDGTDSDDPNAFRYHPTIEPYIKEIQVALNEAVKWIKNEPELSASCRDECPGGLVKWLIGLREYVVRRLAFEPMDQAFPDWDVSRTPESEVLAILMNRVCAALESLPDEKLGSAQISPPAENASVILEALRSAIGRIPNGAKAKPNDVIAEARVAEKAGRAGLRQLETERTYQGFARPKPARYRK